MKITIVDSLKDYNEHVFRLIDEDKIHEPITGMVMTPEIFAKVFTPERLKLLMKLKRNGYKSIYELAKDLDKPYEVVFRNIKYLEGIGLVKADGNGRRRMPHLVGDVRIDLLGSVES